MNHQLYDSVVIEDCNGITLFRKDFTIPMIAEDFYIFIIKRIVADSIQLCRIVAKDQVIPPLRLALYHDFDGKKQLIRFLYISR